MLNYYVKLVKEKIFGSIIEKMQTFGHILDKEN